MSKKNKLESLNQIHGKLEKQDIPKFKPTTLEQVWGYDGLSKYQTMDASLYENSLIVMSKSDLQAHASKVGLVPIDDRDRLIKRLMHEFKLHVSTYRQPQVQNKNIKEISPEIAKILAEGR